LYVIILQKGNKYIKYMMKICNKIYNIQREREREEILNLKLLRLNHKIIGSIRSIDIASITLKA